MHFARKYYPQLMALTGDKGGKRVLNAHLEDTAFLRLRTAGRLQIWTFRKVLRQSNNSAADMTTGIVKIESTVVNEKISEAYA